MKHETPQTQQVSNSSKATLRFKYKHSKRGMKVCLAVYSPITMAVDAYNPFVYLKKFDTVTLVDKNFGFDNCFKVSGKMLPAQGFCNKD